MDVFLEFGGFFGNIFFGGAAGESWRESHSPHRRVWSSAHLPVPFRGGRTAAILCSITSTCRRHEIDPQLYLTQLLINLPTTPTSQLEQWLPDVWKRRQNLAIVADAHAKV